jgi:N-methylhydantoinase B
LTPTEAIESDIPAVVLRKEYATDTAGPSAKHGGAAVLKDTLWLRDAEHWSMPLHAKVASGFGVYGGGDGTARANWVFPPSTFETLKASGALSVDPEICRESAPACGRLDPEAKTLDPHSSYFYFASTPIWRTVPNTVSAIKSPAAGAGATL